MDNMNDNKGLTIRDLVLEIRADVKQLSLDNTLERNRVDAEFARRPTRGEIYSAMTGIAVLIGTVTTIVIGVL